MGGVWGGLAFIQSNELHAGSRAQYLPRAPGGGADTAHVTDRVQVV